MKSASAHLLQLLILLAIITGTGSPARAADEPGDDAKAAIKKRNFPWYDSSNDTYRKLRPTQLKPPDWRLPNFRFPASILQLMLWTVLGVIIALLLIALFQWIRSYIAPIDIEAKTSEITVSIHQLEALPEATRGVRDLLGEATRLAALGAYGQAMTFYHSWQLTQFDKHGMLELQKGKTNRQYVSEVKRSCPDFLTLFRTSTRLFEDAFFGSLEITRDAFEQVWNQRTSFEKIQGGPRT